MKNKIIGIFVSIAICLSLFSFLNCKQVYASVENNNKDYSVFLSGYGEYEVKANSAQIKIGVTCFDNNSSTAFNCLETKIQELKNSISEQFANIEFEDCIDFMHPKFKNGKIGYECSKICTLKISDISQVEEIVSIIKNNDAFVLDTNYKSTEISDAYSKAILDAIDNASQVAKGINENLKIKRVMEQKIIVNNFQNSNENICISAKVLVHFECENTDENKEENTIQSSKQFNRIIPLKKEV